MNIGPQSNVTTARIDCRRPQKPWSSVTYQSVKHIILTPISKGYADDYDCLPSSSEQRKSFLWPAEGLWSTHHKLSTDTIHGWWTRYYQEVHRWRWISSRLLFQRRNTVIRVKPSTSCSQTMESPLITRHSCRPYITNIYIKNMHWFRLASSNQRLVMKSTRRWRVWPGTVNKSRAWPIMATRIQVRCSPLFI